MTCGSDPLAAGAVPVDTDLDSVCNTVDENDDNDDFSDYADDCPRTYGNSTIHEYGCPDFDGDGLSDFSDGFPYDSNRGWDRDDDGIAEEQEGPILDKFHERFMPIPIFVLFVTIALILSFIVIVIGRRGA